MQMHPLIVAMVSDDPRCRPVLRMAAALACQYEGMVLPVHVVREFVVLGTPGFVPPQAPGAREEVHARAAEHVRELAGPLPELRLRLFRGDPAYWLARTAREVRADLIVVGHPPSWGGLFERRMVRRLLGMCRVPVLAVPVADDKHSAARRLRRVLGFGRRPPAERELARLLAARSTGEHSRPRRPRRRYGS